MATLHVHLQDGFTDDHVRIDVDGRVACDQPHVRTRPQLGLAEAFELEVPAGALAVRVQLPGRGVERSIVVDPSTTPYLGLSLSPDGELTHRLSDTTFGYV